MNSCVVKESDSVSCKSYELGLISKTVVKAKFLRKKFLLNLNGFCFLGQQLQEFEAVIFLPLNFY